MPAPATGVPPAGHGAHGKASWTLALGAGSLGRQDSHRRDRQKGDVPLRWALVSLALLELGPRRSEKGLAPAVLNITSFLSHFSPGSSDKIDKRNDKMKRRGSSDGGRRNFETWKKKIPQPSPAQPHRKAKIRRRQPLSPSLLQPRDPCRPPEATQFSESPRKRSQRSCAPAVKQKETCKTDSAKQRTERKDAAELPSSPIPSRPSGEGTKSPKKATSTFPKGPVPHACPSRGNPTFNWGQSFTKELRGPACKDEGCRSRGRAPPDPALALLDRHRLWLLPPAAPDQERQGGLCVPLARSPLVGKGCPLELVLCFWNGGCFATPP